MVLSNLTPIVSLWIPKDVKQLFPDSHILPNTFWCPYRNNFVRCAKLNPNRKIIFVALTTGLSLEHIEKATSLEQENHNIVFIPLENINFGKYDVPIKTENGKFIHFSDYLKNRHMMLKEDLLPFAIEIDLVRILLGLKGCKFLLEAGIPANSLPEENSLIISDLDILPQEEIVNVELIDDIALLEDVFNGYRQLENGLLVISEPENNVLVGIYKYLKIFPVDKYTDHNMILTMQLLAIMKYCCSIQHNDEDITTQEIMKYCSTQHKEKDITTEEIRAYLNEMTTEEIRAYLEERIYIISNKYGPNNVINSKFFHKFMSSGRCKFSYNNGKKISHKNIELNSPKGWPENLYETEIREMSEKFFFNNVSFEEIKNKINLMLYPKSETVYKYSYDYYYDYDYFYCKYLIKLIEYLYESATKERILKDSVFRNFFFKKLGQIFMEVGPIGSQLGFQIKILDYILKNDETRKNIKYIKQILFLTSHNNNNNNSNISNGMTLDKFFNLFLKYDMLKNITNRNELLSTLIILEVKKIHYFSDISLMIEKLEGLFAKSKRFTPEEISETLIYIENILKQKEF